MGPSRCKTKYLINWIESNWTKLKIFDKSSVYSLAVGGTGYTPSSFLPEDPQACCGYMFFTCYFVFHIVVEILIGYIRGTISGTKDRTRRGQGQGCTEDGQTSNSQTNKSNSNICSVTLLVWERALSTTNYSPHCQNKRQDFQKAPPFLTSLTKCNQHSAISKWRHRLVLDSEQLSDMRRTALRAPP